ncbi:hypothetical protein MAR_031957 [Mya arenaria]|uniref:Secreted protein n=1 Tax=Mya arenaria TaxID=6604 RepID=A0ABY7F9K3_MYAAR|nr:uncharacterized protein LOC128205304 [Mya arenaria]XP_052762798.1 uncharacterized protein LOC128205304 [Mya arenaria]XP_052762799.1 uncharacterized protein LOC128205304 [Mya arenaria]WAR17363.1 hypothetical protein MAR_031957 [Mya arenaria]
MKLLLTCVCACLLLQTTHAMFGLCSTDWFTDGCFDFKDECKHMGGECRHDGYGDHGEGCLCIKKTWRADRLEYETLTKDHFKGKGKILYTIFLKQAGKLNHLKKPTTPTVMTKPKQKPIGTA